MAMCVLHSSGDSLNCNIYDVRWLLWVYTYACMFCVSVKTRRTVLAAVHRRDWLWRMMGTWICEPTMSMQRRNTLKTHVWHRSDHNINVYSSKQAEHDNEPETVLTGCLNRTKTKIEAVWRTWELRNCTEENVIESKQS